MTEPVETELVKRLRETTWRPNVTDTLMRWDDDRREAADEIERLQAELDRIERNRAMWKGQCERQAEQLAIMRQNLTDTTKAIEVLPMDCMGVGGRDDPLGGTRWYIRDELLANCRAALAAWIAEAGR